MKKILIMAFTLCALSSFAQTHKIVYPKTVKGNTVDTYFGVKVADPYRWLENDTSVATKNWVIAQNKVTSSYLSKIPFRQKIFDRFKSLNNYEKLGSPFKQNGKYYFYKNNGLQNQSVLYVQDSPTGTPVYFLILINCRLMVR